MLHSQFFILSLFLPLSLSPRFISLLHYRTCSLNFSLILQVLSHLYTLHILFLRPKTLSCSVSSRSIPYSTFMFYCKKTLSPQSLLEATSSHQVQLGTHPLCSLTSLFIALATPQTPPLSSSSLSHPHFSSHSASPASSSGSLHPSLGCPQPLNHSSSPQFALPPFSPNP